MLIQKMKEKLKKKWRYSKAHLIVDSKELENILNLNLKISFALRGQRN